MYVFNTGYESGDLAVNYYGKEHCTPGHSYSVQFKNEFLMHYISDGEGIFKVKGEEYKLKKGNAFVIAADRGYYEASKDNPWSYLWVNFSGEIAKSFFKLNGISSSYPVYQTNESDAVTSCFEEFVNIGGKNQFLILSRFFELLGTMTETNADKPEHNMQTTADEYINVCKNYIKDNYYRKITMTELSSCVGLEYSYLFRLFKAELGISPGNYIINYKLSKAANFLRTTNMNVSEASLAVGYTDRVAFTRLFTKKYGMPPHKYKIMEI